MFQLEAHLTRDFTETFLGFTRLNLDGGRRSRASMESSSAFTEQSSASASPWATRSTTIISLTAGYMATVNDSGSDRSAQMDGFRISLTYGWHKIVEDRSG